MKESPVEEDPATPHDESENPSRASSATPDLPASAGSVRALPGGGGSQRHGRYVIAPDSAMPVQPAVTARLAEVLDQFQEAASASERFRREDESAVDTESKFLDQNDLTRLRARLGDLATIDLLRTLT